MMQDVSIQKWGNSLAIRIPYNYAKYFHISSGSHVSLIKENDRMIIIPQKENDSLRTLLSKITKDNIHDEEFQGDSVGKEAL